MDDEEVGRRHLGELRATKRGRVHTDRAGTTRNTSVTVVPGRARFCLTLALGSCFPTAGSWSLPSFLPHTTAPAAWAQAHSLAREATAPTRASKSLVTAATGTLAHSHQASALALVLFFTRSPPWHRHFPHSQAPAPAKAVWQDMPAASAISKENTKVRAFIFFPPVAFSLPFRQSDTRPSPHLHPCHANNAPISQAAGQWNKRGLGGRSVAPRAEIPVFADVNDPTPRNERAPSAKRESRAADAGERVRGIALVEESSQHCNASASPLPSMSHRGQADEERAQAQGGARARPALSGLSPRTRPFPRG